MSLLLISGCSKVRGDHIPGKYTCKYPYGTETLVVSGDGKYEQTIQLSSGSLTRNSGTWTYDTKSQNITLHDAIVVDDGFGSQRQQAAKGLRILSVASKNGEVHIGVDNEQGFEFVP